MDFPLAECETCKNESTNPDNFFRCLNCSWKKETTGTATGYAPKASLTIDAEETRETRKEVTPMPINLDEIIDNLDAGEQIPNSIVRAMAQEIEALRTEIELFKQMNERK